MSEEPKKVAYFTPYIKQTLTIMVMDVERELPLSDFADGCMGVSLWFDTLEHAQEWAGKEAEIKMATYEVKP